MLSTVYKAEMLEKSEKLLFKDYKKFAESPGYQYDLVSIRQQVLSNRALECYNEICGAYDKKDTESFKKYSEEFLELADKMDAVTGESEYYSLSRYLKFADTVAEDKDDFTRRVYRISAKSLITTLGSYVMSENRGHDYSNRQWSGLISGFYRKRWEMFFKKCLDELSGLPTEEINWFEWEWNWVRNND